MSLGIFKVNGESYFVLAKLVPGGIADLAHLARWQLESLHDEMGRLLGCSRNELGIAERKLARYRRLARNRRRASA